MSDGRAHGPDAVRRRVLHALALAPLLGTRALRGATPARVVVAGGGFGGASCALALRRLDPRIDVTLVDPQARYVTGPMSNAVVAGWRKLDSITFDRSGLERAGVRVVTDRVTAIDAEQRRVRCARGDALAYERLVVAPGIRLLWGTPEGYDEAAAQQMPHAWLPGAQTALLAAKLRAVGDGAVVAISVPFGLMRCPPGPYERAGVIAAWLAQHRKRSKVLIFDCNNHFPKQDAFTAAWDELYPGMIEWFGATDGGAVGRVDARTSTLYTARGAQRVALASVIPRQAAGQLALDAGLSHGRGWCAVDARTFESKRLPQVHIIGDACAAGAMPKAASSAQAQALQCAAAIVAALRETPLPPADLASACYSLLARERALSFHARFEIDDAEIRQAPSAPPARQPNDSEEAQLAARWYREAVARAFAA